MALMRLRLNGIDTRLVASAGAEYKVMSLQMMHLMPLCRTTPFGCNPPVGGKIENFRTQRPARVNR